MSIDLVFLMAVATVASTLVLLGRLIGLRTILRYATWIDLGFAVIAGAALHGTLTGILVAIVGGLVMALVLQSGRMLLAAYDRGYRAAERTVPFMRTVKHPEMCACGCNAPVRGSRDPFCDPAMPHVDFGA